MGDETVPKSITAAHAFWDDVYTRSPFLGAILTGHRNNAKQGIENTQLYLARVNNHH